MVENEQFKEIAVAITSILGIIGGISGFIYTFSMIIKVATENHPIDLIEKIKCTIKYKNLHRITEADFLLMHNNEAVEYKISDCIFHTNYAEGCSHIIEERE